MANNTSESENAEAEKSALLLILGYLAGLVGRVILTIVFFGFFMPIGFVIRLFGKDPLQRKLESKVDSYYCTSKVRPSDHMDRPF